MKFIKKSILCVILTFSFVITMCSAESDCTNSLSDIWYIWIGGTVEKPIWTVSKGMSLSNMDKYDIWNVKILSEYLRAQSGVSSFVLAPSLYSIDRYYTDNLMHKSISVPTTNNTSLASCMLEQLSDKTNSNIVFELKPTLEDLLCKSYEVNFSNHPVIITLTPKKHSKELLLSLTSKLFHSSKQSKLKILNGLNLCLTNDSLYCSSTNINQSIKILKMKPKDLKKSLYQMKIQELEEFWTKEIFCHLYYIGLISSNVQIKNMYIDESYSFLMVEFSEPVYFQELGRLMSGMYLK